jgi:hypothetical protein
LGQNDATGLITYTDEDGGTTSANVVSGDGLDPNNILIVGSDGGSLLTSDTLSNAIRTVSNTITQIVTTTLTSSTIQALETTTVLTQSDTTGVITYVNEDSNTTNVEVTSADPDNFLLTGTDGGTKLDSNTLIAAIDSVSSTISSITGDHLGNHIAEQNIDLGTYQLVGDSRNTGTSGTNGLSVATNGSVGINDTTPDASAALQVGYVSSNPQGMLIPKINLQSLTDGSTIPNPEKGLMVYNTGNNSNVREGFYWNHGTKASPKWVTPEIVTPEIGSTVRKVIYNASEADSTLGNALNHGIFQFRFSATNPGMDDGRATPQIRVNSFNNQIVWYDVHELFNGNGFQYSVPGGTLLIALAWTDLPTTDMWPSERNEFWFQHGTDIYHINFVIRGDINSGDYTFIIISEKY